MRCPLLGLHRNHGLLKIHGVQTGAKGYFHLPRNVNACGLAEYVSYIKHAEIIHEIIPTGTFVSENPPDYEDY